MGNINNFNVIYLLSAGNPTPVGSTAGKTDLLGPMTAARFKRVFMNSLVHVILGILAVIWLFPIFWDVMTSLRKESGAYTSYFFPKKLTFDNYIRLFTETPQLNFQIRLYQ